MKSKLFVSFGLPSNLLLVSCYATDCAATNLNPWRLPADCSRAEIQHHPAVFWLANLVPADIPPPKHHRITPRQLQKREPQANVHGHQPNLNQMCMDTMHTNCVWWFWGVGLMAHEPHHVISLSLSPLFLGIKDEEKLCTLSYEEEPMVVGKCMPTGWQGMG